MDVLYGSVDGQKFSAATPTSKARHSRKYFGKDRGVVAYTLLANHVALQTQMLGANQHESYWVFDICYNNTADIMPTTITGDMHSINMANFAILYWFGMNLAPLLLMVGVVIKMSGLIWLGAVLFGAALLFHLVTLPVEFDASRRALQYLKERGISGDDLAELRKLLDRLEQQRKGRN